LPRRASPSSPFDPRSTSAAGPRKMSSRTEQVAARARLAPLLSILVLAATGLGAVAYLYQAGLFGRQAPASLPHVETPDQVTSGNATVTGYDKDKLPYTVNAAKGFQDAANDKVIHLETVAGEFQRATGTPIKVDAKTAKYDSTLKHLMLEGSVVIKDDGRYTATMEKAEVAVEDKKLTSNVPVVVTMENGTIAANGLAITNDGKNILFTNGVKAHFGGGGGKGDGKQ
jgi:LPS export ABC transporter protein LptC